MALVPLPPELNIFVSKVTQAWNNIFFATIKSRHLVGLLTESGQIPFVSLALNTIKEITARHVRLNEGP